MADARGQAPTGQPEPGKPVPGNTAQGITQRQDTTQRKDTTQPSAPAETRGGSWLAAFKRTLPEFADDQLTDRAAALTYYAVLSIFPGLLVVVSLLGLLGKSATQPLLTNFLQVAPSNVKQIIEPELARLQGAHASASFAAIL